MKKLLKDLSLEEIKQLIKESIQDSAVEEILKEEEPENTEEPEEETPQWLTTILTPPMQGILKRWGARILGKPYMKRIDILFPTSLISDLNNKDSYVKKELAALSQKTAPVVTQIKKRLLKDRIKATVNGEPYLILQCTWGEGGNLVFKRVV